MKKIFVAGIDTNAGKTLVAAILVEALEADYWKPVQAGDLDNSDTMKVQGLVTNTKSKFHPEQFRLSIPMSPHVAARRDGLGITLSDFTCPATTNRLIVEGAGGLMSPLNDNTFVIDLVKTLDVEVVLVSRNYLGSINHTLLSAMALKHHNVKVKGIIFNGEPMEGTEEIILSETGYRMLGRIDEEEVIDKNVVARYAADYHFLLDE
ncbi:MAG: dethiobiotin synthase [Taibaiella sp.]|nr:dethiobiotin synthase [Taibaiella sp.]